MGLVLLLAMKVSNCLSCSSIGILCGLICCLKLIDIRKYLNHKEYIEMNTFTVTATSDQIPSCVIFFFFFLTADQILGQTKQNTIILNCGVNMSPDGLKNLERSMFHDVIKEALSCLLILNVFV